MEGPEGAPEGAGELVARALETFQPLPDLKELRGSVVLLEVLDELEPGNPHRAGVRAKLFHRRADGKSVLVPLAWEQELPTQDRVARMVEAGQLPAGDYTVELRKGGATSPPIRYSIARLEGQAGAQVDPLGGALRVLEVLRGGALLPQGEPAQADVAEEVRQAVEEALAPVVKRLTDLETLAGELMAGGAGKAGGGGASEVLTTLLTRLIERPAQAPSSSGNVAAHVSRA